MDPQHFESLYPPDSRFEEIQKMLSLIKAGNSVQLVSLPGVGRSNLMGLLAYNRKARELHLKDQESQYHFLVIAFSDLKNRPIHEVTKYLLIEMVDSLKSRKKINESEFGEKIIKEAIKSNDELLLFQALRNTIEYLAVERGMTVVLMFDKFEEYIPSIHSQFFANLRALRHRAKYKFSVVFSLTKPLEDVLEPEMLSDFYELVVGNIIYLSIKDDRILDFRLSYIEESSGKKAPQKIRAEIIRLSGGHGKLARLCLEAYLSDETRKNLSDFLLSKGRVIGVLNEIWSAFSPFEQKLIHDGIANNSPNLIALGLVKNGRIIIPLLDLFAKAKEISKEKLEYNKAKREIKKGETVISEGLTSLELKLLIYFLENADSIIDRDSLVNAVWGELASTSGVSEQALDQLVFRLRKKIEEDPNNPSYIQTVKGRGFKFSS